VRTALLKKEAAEDAKATQDNLTRLMNEGPAMLASLRQTEDEMALRNGAIAEEIRDACQPAGWGKPFSSTTG